MCAIVVGATGGCDRVEDTPEGYEKLQRFINEFVPPATKRFGLPSSSRGTVTKPGAPPPYRLGRARRTALGPRGVMNCGPFTVGQEGET